MNWKKSYLLSVGNANDITIDKVKRVSEDNPYVHLDIPVETETRTQLRVF